MTDPLDRLRTLEPQLPREYSEVVLGVIAEVERLRREVDAVSDLFVFDVSKYFLPGTPGFRVAMPDGSVGAFHTRHEARAAIRKAAGLEGE